MGDAVSSITPEQVNMISNPEFTECLADLGEVENYNKDTSDALLTKAKSVSPRYVILVLTILVN